MGLKSFFFPRFTWRYALRVAGVAAAAYLIFGHVTVFTRINGASMEPAYRDGSWIFCSKLRYLFHAPRLGDVVTVRMAGDRVMYLKRVVALAGDTVEFRDGILFVNGQPRREPQVLGPCDWNLPPRQVAPGNVYVVGDNRSVPIELHMFGQTAVSRIAGGPLW